MSRRHILLGSAALLVSMPVFAAETSGGVPAAVAPTRHAQVKCATVSNVPMTADAEQALPLRLVRSLACGENVAILSDSEGYTVHVRAQDGKDGYVALMYLSSDRTASANFADSQPTSATPVNGVVRWQSGAAGCDQFMSQGHLVESATANGLTVQVSLEDTGWKFRTSVAVSNNGDSTADVFPSLISLDELQPGLHSLRAQDPKKLSHAKNHQVLWTQANAQPSPSAVSEHNRNTISPQNASYRTQDYLAQGASASSAKIASQAESDNVVALSLKAAKLQPSQRTVGVVWFEREANAHELSLRVPVGELIFDFPLSFDQKK